LARIKSVNKSKTEWFEVNIVLRQDDRLVPGKKREQQPEVKKHRHQFAEVVNDPLLESTSSIGAA